MAKRLVYISVGPNIFKGDPWLSDKCVETFADRFCNESASEYLSRAFYINSADKMVERFGKPSKSEEVK